MPEFSEDQIDAMCDLIAAGPRLVRHYRDSAHVEFSHIEGRNGQRFSSSRHREALDLMKGVPLLRITLAPKKPGQDMYELRGDAQAFYQRYRKMGRDSEPRRRFQTGA
jgi:hypothetical protein